MALPRAFRLRSDSIPMGDGSVLVARSGVVAFDCLGTHETNLFGRIKVGDRGVSRIVVRMFGLNPADWTRMDAFVRVEFDDGRPAKGFPCAVKDVGGGRREFRDRKVRGLTEDGGCPICLESDVERMAAIQGLGCGHGMCMRCLVEWNKSESETFPACPVCRGPGRIDDAFHAVLARAAGGSIDLRGVAARMGYDAARGGAFYRLGFYHQWGGGSCDQREFWGGALMCVSKYNMVWPFVGIDDDKYGDEAVLEVKALIAANERDKLTARLHEVEAEASANAARAAAQAAQDAMRVVLAANEAATMVNRAILAACAAALFIVVVAALAWRRVTRAAADAIERADQAANVAKDAMHVAEEAIASAEFGGMPCRSPEVQPSPPAAADEHSPASGKAAPPSPSPHPQPPQLQHPQPPHPQPPHPQPPLPTVHHRSKHNKKGIAPNQWDPSPNPWSSRKAAAASAAAAESLLPRRIAPSTSNRCG